MCDEVHVIMHGLPQGQRYSHEGCSWQDVFIQTPLHVIAFAWPITPSSKAKVFVFSPSWHVLNLMLGKHVILDNMKGMSETCMFFGNKNNTKKISKVDKIHTYKWTRNYKISHHHSWSILQPMATQPLCRRVVCHIFNLHLSSFYP